MEAASLQVSDGKMLELEGPERSSNLMNLSPTAKGLSMSAQTDPNSSQDDPPSAGYSGKAWPGSRCSPRCHSQKAVKSGTFLCARSTLGELSVIYGRTVINLSYEAKF